MNKTIGRSGCFLFIALLFNFMLTNAPGQTQLLKCIWITLAFLLSMGVQAQLPDSLRKGESANRIPTKDSLGKRNENTILNPLKEKQDNSLYYKLNYAGHHLHRAGRNTIAVGGILAVSVAAVLLFNTVLKPKVQEDNIPINFVYGGLGLSFLLCSTKGGYHLIKAGKAMKDPRFFKQDKTIYDL
jgi:hypothetical protein